MRKLFYGVIANLLFVSTIQAQLPTIDIPVSNQKALVMQTIGLTEITVTYHRPQVNSRKIWGDIVPFNKNAHFPWRAGDRETTLIEFTHDVKIEGQALSAGKYGLHMLIHEDETATVIFSNNFNSWGSFTYKQEEDALRVKVEMKTIPHREWLTYEFTEQMSSYTVLSLIWEKKAIPFKIEVDVANITMASIDYQLEGVAGGFWQNTLWAARYAASVGKVEEAIELSNIAVTQSRVFTHAIIIQTDILYDLNRKEEADKIMADFIAGPDATAQVVYRHGRRLINTDKTEEALIVYEKQHERFPDHYLTSLGLGRVYSKLGEFKKAINYVRKSQTAYNKLAYNFQTDSQRAAFERYIKTLESNEDINN